MSDAQAKRLVLVDGSGYIFRAFFAWAVRSDLIRSNPALAVRLPKEYQFSSDEVFIRKEGEDVILSPRPRDWRSYLESAPVASDAFMTDVEDLPVQERDA